MWPAKVKVYIIFLPHFISFNADMCGHVLRIKSNTNFYIWFGFLRISKISQKNSLLFEYSLNLKKMQCQRISASMRPGIEHDQVSAQSVMMCTLLWWIMCNVCWLTRQPLLVFLSTPCLINCSSIAP